MSEPRLDALRLWVVHAPGDAARVRPLLDLLARTRLVVEVFTGPDEALDRRGADRVLLAWSREALGDEGFNHALSRCVARQGDRLAVLPLDDTPPLSVLRQFRRERLMEALGALGDGDSPRPLDRLLTRARRIERVGFWGYLGAAVCCVALLILFGVRTPTPQLDQLDRIQVGIFLCVMLVFVTSCLGLFWSWLDGRFLADRVARFLVDRTVDRARVGDLR